MRLMTRVLGAGARNLLVGAPFGGLAGAVGSGMPVACGFGSAAGVLIIPLVGLPATLMGLSLGAAAAALYGGWSGLRRAPISWRKGACVALFTGFMAGAATTCAILASPRYFHAAAAYPAPRSHLRRR